MSETNAYIGRLLESNPLREPLLRRVIRDLQLPPGSQGLDAGCGIGLQAMLLAEAIGPTGHVTGLDISPELLRYGEEAVKESGFSERISFQEGDVSNLPFEENAFDWVWSADCVGYPSGDLPPLLKEICKVVKTGGRVVILAWTSQTLLPGYPLLEARLNATCSAYAPYLSGKQPETHFLRALEWFKKARLEDVEGRTYVGEVQAPLSNELRIALVSLFQMLWGERQPETSPEDWAECQRLCQPGSPDFILDIPGYYAFFTYSLFRGKVSI